MNSTIESSLIAEADILIVEGTISACVAALKFAKEGKKVVICASGTSLPFEVAACRRGWVNKEELNILPEELRQIFSKAIMSESEIEYYLNTNKLASLLEDILLDNNISIYYGMSPCALNKTENTISEVIFAAKPGLQSFSTKHIIDCTETAHIARLAGCEIEYNRSCEISWTSQVRIDVQEVDSFRITKDGRKVNKQDFTPVYPEESFIEFKNVKGLVDNKVLLHGAFAEFRISCDYSLNDTEFLSKAFNLCHETVQVASVQMSDKLLYRVPDNILFATAPLKIKANHFSNLHICEYSQNPYSRVSAIEKISFKEAKAASLYSNDKNQQFDFDSLPLLGEWDILVVGAGTSGVPAAISASEQKTSTVLLEKHFGLGGTHTIGGVGNYWFGNDSALREKLDAEYSEIMKTGIPKSMAMRTVLTNRGVTVLSGMSCVGTLTEEQNVRGIVVASSNGLCAIKAKVIIDASGDADVAAWGGAEYEYGNGRDTLSLWSSFGAWLPERNNVSRHYESTVDIRDSRDLSREIIASRRRIGLWSRSSNNIPEIPQHNFTPRESRRLKGRKQITYSGILAGETFSDVLHVFRSNFDIKGIASSDMIRCGFIWSWDALENFDVAVPFGALLPEKLENILVVGRAYSASHDAMSLARMQKDLIALGAAAGIAAGMSVAANCPVSEINIGKLQKVLIQNGIISKKELATWAKDEEIMTDRQMRDSVNSNLYKVLRQGDKACPVLREAFDAADNEKNKSILGRALCLLGDSYAVDYLTTFLRDMLLDGLPKQKTLTLWAPPEHGWAPEAVYLIYAIGLVGKTVEALPELEKLVEIIKGEKDNFNSKESEFEYILAICQAIERSANPALIPVLKDLLKKPCFKAPLLLGDDPRDSLDVALDRCGYLYLCIGRALARCGDALGYEILTECLSDMRGVLAGSARQELAEFKTCKDKTFKRKIN